MGWKTSVAILLFLLVLLPPQLPAARRRKECAGIKDFDKILQRAVELEGAGDSDALAECLGSGTSRFPERYEGWLRLGERLKNSGRADEAAENFRAGLRSLRGEDAQGVATLTTGLANALEALGRDAEASDLYERVTTMAPLAEVAWYNLGYFKMTHSDFDAALPAFQKAVALQPSFGRAIEAVGAIYFGTGEEEQALPYFRDAARLLPAEVATQMNLANALGKLDFAGEAMGAYDAVLALEPTHPDAICKSAYFALQVCDWREYNPRLKRVRALVLTDLAAGQTSHLIPFNALFMPFSISEQLQIAQSFAAKNAAILPLPVPAGLLHPAMKRPVRVGYLSADFRDHPMGRDLSVLLPAHSKSEFLVLCYAQNPPHQVHDKGFRARLEEGVHALRDINPLGDLEAAELMQADGIHVLVDLMGYTHGARTAVLAHRPAPVQVAFKGYMSTSGSSYVPLIVADQVSVPPELAPFYSEKQVYLSPVFAASTHATNHPEVFRSDAKVSRQAAGLPEDVFVFACFNSAYKIAPTIFLAWISILKQVPKSVLWILDPPAEARANLRREAKAQGVSPTRLVFTDKVDMGKHLLVKANADLFLDTPIYNAHSTAADAFWAGLPMVTLPREKMAGRVCASLALSLSLQLQIARSLSEYISLAVTLARRKHTLRRLRKLLAKRRTDPLHGRMFDVAGWMEAYEKGLKMAVEVAASGIRSREGVPGAMHLLVQPAA